MKNYLKNIKRFDFTQKFNLFIDKINMKNYLKNIKRFDFTQRFNLFIEKIKQININSFKTILIVYAIIFSVFLFLAIPGLYNYQNYYDKIKKQTLSDFKLKLGDIKKVKYRFVPKPHILIEGANLAFVKDEELSFAKLKKIKIYISLIDLYRKDKISIKEIVINNGNFYFKKKTFINFLEHLNKTIIKPIKVINSNFFYLNKNEDVANISPIKELNYFIDSKLREKNLKIKGKLFDVNYNFYWKKNYNKPNIIESNIVLNNPNISISNKLVKNYENNINDGILKTNFLNNKININYKTHNEKINFITDNNNLNSNYQIKLNGNVILEPFFFDTKIDLSNLDYGFLINKFLPTLYIYRDTVHSNINGKSMINIDNVKNKLLNNIEIMISFHDKKIILDKFKIKIKKIGDLRISNVEYVNREEKIYIRSKMQLNIMDQRQFYYRFQVPKKNRINIKKIYFDLEKNLDENEYYISNINLNSLENNLSKQNSEIYFDEEITNIQTLTKLINEYFRKINLG